MEYANNTAAQQTIAAYAATKTENALPDNYVDEKSINCNVNTASPIDLLYSPNIRGGRKMVGSCGCNGMTGGNGGSGGSGGNGGSSGNGEESNQEIIGGCLSCKKGGKRIVFIYKTIHIIIPRLYKKYKSSSVSSPEKIMEIAKVPKVKNAARVPKAAKAAKAARLANTLRVKNAARAARAARAVKKL